MTRLNRWTGLIELGHEEKVKSEIRCKVVTVSSSRTEESDRSGDVIENLLTADDHSVVSRAVVPDEPGEVEVEIREGVSGRSRVVILTGGTGLSLRDQTVDVLARLQDKELPGFGEKFRDLSFEDIGPRAILSRARAALVDDTLVFALPGSPAAVELAMEQLILPVIGHALYEIDKEVEDAG